MGEDSSRWSSAGRPSFDNDSGQVPAPLRPGVEAFEPGTETSEEEGRPERPALAGAEPVGSHPQQDANQQATKRSTAESAEREAASASGKVAESAEREAASASGKVAESAEREAASASGEFAESAEREAASAPGEFAESVERASEQERRHPLREACADVIEQLSIFPWRRVVMGLFWVTALGVVLSVLAVVVLIQHYARDLPDVATLESGYAPPQVTRVLAHDGTLLADVFSERRTVVPFERIPDHVKSAFLAAEDAAFYQHRGLDYLGLLRALVVNLRAGEVRQGGSTITQQVVKNVLLDHERTYERKIRETILAYRIEKKLNKEQILGMYMNHIYLGHGRYGVEEASRFYFGKHVEEIDVGEAALIAGIVAAPERYSPRKSETLALARRKYVLGQMLDKGFMTREAYEAYVEAPIRLTPHPETESDLAPEVVSQAKRMLAEVAPGRARQGGFTVRTTIDPELQVIARRAVQEGLDDYFRRQKLAPPFTLEKRRLWGPLFEGMPRQHGIYTGRVVERDDEDGTIDVQVGQVLGRVDLRSEERFNPTHQRPTKFVGPQAALRVRVLDDPRDATGEAPVRLALELGPQAAMVVLDAENGDVLATVGSYEGVAGGLDRTVQARRQPGSAFKPIVYSYALSTGEVTAATRFRFPVEGAKEEAEDPRGDDGEEETEYEVLSFRRGVEKSDNRIARRVFRRVGPRRVVSWARALGIESRLLPDESLALGAYEVTPLELTSAYLPFASAGRVVEPRFFKSIESGEGPVDLPQRAPMRQVMEPAAAYLMTHILQGVIEKGTARRASSLNRPLAGKTGTTNQAKDAWFVGYSVDYVVGVWVGYDDALPLGWGESGATSALPIWMKFMESAHGGDPAVEFPRPVGIVTAEIDPETGLLARYGQEDAESEIFLEGTVPEDVAPRPEEPDENDGRGEEEAQHGEEEVQDGEERPSKGKRGEADAAEPPNDKGRNAEERPSREKRSETADKPGVGGPGKEAGEPTKEPGTSKAPPPPLEQPEPPPF